MTEGQRRATIAELTGYRGEVSPRRTPVAVILDVVMPGLGFVYLGRLRRGIGVYLATALAFATFCAIAWGTNLFLPRAALIAATGWVYVQVMLAIRLRRHVRRDGDDYVLGRFNHPLVYAGLVLALEVAPGWALARFASDHVLLAFTVRDHNGFPELLPGDRVYGSRGAFEAEPPGRGALVVVDGVVDGPTVLRVVAVPGDEVALEGGTVIVNGVPRYREPLGGIEILGRDPPPAAVESIHAWREFTGRVSYEIYVPDGLEPRDLPPQRLLTDQYYLLADHRDVEDVRDSRQLGPIERRHIVGQPLWIWWSVAPDEGRVRWRRVGLEVR